MEWLSEGANSWQLTAATLVGLMSIPGLVVLYGGVMQKRWSVNSMMMAFVAFAIVLILWVPVRLQDGVRRPDAHLRRDSGFFGNFWGKPGSILSSHEPARTGAHPGAAGRRIPLPAVDAGLLPDRLRGDHADPDAGLGARAGSTSRPGSRSSRSGRVLVYTINAFLIWGGGFFAQQGAVDFSGGYVIHLAAGVSGFVAAAVIGPRLQRDREVDAPNNLAMVAVGAGLLWMGWNGFNGGDWYSAGEIASAAVLNTNLCTAVAFLVWVALRLPDRPQAEPDRQRQRDDRRPRRDHPRRRFRQRLGRDHHRRRRLDARLLRAQLPEPGAAVPQRRRHPRASSTPTASPGSPAASWSASSPTS